MVHCNLFVSFDRSMTHGSQVTCGIFWQYVKYDLMWQRTAEIKVFKHNCYWFNFCLVCHFVVVVNEFFVLAVKVIQLTVFVNYLFTLSCLPLNNQMYDKGLTANLCPICSNVWHMAHCELVPVVYIWMDVYHMVHWDLVVYLADVWRMAHCDLDVYLGRCMTHGSMWICGIFRRYMKYELIRQWLFS